MNVKVNKHASGRLSVLAVAVASAFSMPAAQAFNIDTGNSDLKVNWDNTVKYTAAYRINNPDQNVAISSANPNVDFGDLGHQQGLINNRADLLSELDVKYKNIGLRLSGAAWYDAEYAKDTNDFNGAAPNNQLQLGGAPLNRTTKSSQNLMGKRAEVADAFVFGKFALNEEQNLTVRAGQHTLLFGETLFLGANGIAAAQGPVDLVKAFSLPNAQFKEIAMPVGQVSASWQISPGMSLSAYTQYEWKAMRLPAAGSYFSMADFVGDGADLLLAPNGPAFRTGDAKGRDTGQFGLQFKFKVGDVDYGLYAARYDDKGPQAVLNWNSHTYNLMYARNIEMYGASASTVLGETNVAIEASTRRNTPLGVVGDLIISSMANADNDKNTPYARGNSFHMNLSAITLLPATPLWHGASFVGEFAYNRLLDVTHNPVNSVTNLPALNSTHTRDASAFRFVFQPEYFQVMPGVDLQVPIGVGYGLSGRSAIFQASPEHGGDVSVGFNFDVQKTWKAGLNIVHYFGPAGPAPAVNVAAGSYASYKNYYADRDYVSFTVQRTF
jgi:hypothetical protein